MATQCGADYCYWHIIAKWLNSVEQFIVSGSGIVPGLPAGILATNLNSTNFTPPYAVYVFYVYCLTTLPIPNVTDWWICGNGTLLEWYWQGNANMSEKNLSQRHFAYAKSHINWTGLVSNPNSVARGRRLVHCLRYVLYARYFEIYLCPHCRWRNVISVKALDTSFFYF